MDEGKKLRIYGFLMFVMLMIFIIVLVSNINESRSEGFSEKTISNEYISIPGEYIKELGVRYEGIIDGKIVLEEKGLRIYVPARDNAVGILLNGDQISIEMNKDGESFRLIEINN